MYTEIEQVFKTNAKYAKPKKILVFAFVVWATSFILIINFCGAKMNSSFWTIFLTCISSLIIPTVAYGYILFNIKNEKDFKEKKVLLRIFYFSNNINIYKNLLHKSDIELLIKYLKNNGINTRPKVLEAVHHYQSILPRKILVGIQIVPFLALVISVLAFIFSGSEIFNSVEDVGIICLIVGVVILIYIEYCFLNEKIFKSFGNEELYKRLEDCLSEIYMHSLIK